VCKLNRTPQGWLVPSQSKGETIYQVNPEKKTCTCPDHQEAGFKCKHLYAVEITAKREVHADGSITNTRSMTFTEKVTYKQDWPAYNLAQATEKRRLQVLLYDLCRKLPERERDPSRKGPKPHLIRDCVFAMAFKVYCGLSWRRFSCDLLDAHEKGHVTKPIPGAKVTAFFEDPYFTPILKALIAHSARPLRAVETDFAIDSSGFGSSRYERWYDQKYGITRLKCLWIKTHIACGVKTNVVTAVRILDKDAADSPQFVPLIMRGTQRDYHARPFAAWEEVDHERAFITLDAR
jgi:hypothetical protein